MNTDEQLTATVRNIAHELEAIADGELYEDENGEYTEEKTYTDEDGEEQEREPVSIYDYIGKRALSIEHWKIDKNGDCVGGEILFCFGGPSVWGTEKGVFGAWGRDRAEFFSSQAGDILLDYLIETKPSR